MEAFIAIGLFVVAVGLFYVFVVRKNKNKFPDKSQLDDGFDPEYPPEDS